MRGLSSAPQEAPQQRRPRFLWPAPRAPGTFAACDPQPSEARHAELREPFDDAGCSGSSGRGGGEGAAVDGSPGGFRVPARPPGQLFTADAAFWCSVHEPPGVGVGGGGARRQGGGAAGVEDGGSRGGRTRLRTLLAAPTGDRAAAPADRFAPLLRDPPVKKGFAIAAAPPAPLSMGLDVPWEPANAGGGGDGGGGNGGGGRPEKEQQVAAPPPRFDTLCRGRPRSCVHRPGFSDAWR